MILGTIREVKKPVIVLTGHNGCGKSYAAKIVRNDLDITVNLNRYDFITRWLMYIADINPALTDYNQISLDSIDYHMINDPSKRDMLDYIKDSVKLAKGINADIVSYILQHIFKCTNINVPQLNEQYMVDYYKLFNDMYANKKYVDTTLLFKLTIDFFDLLLSQYYDWNSKLDTYRYLDNVLEPYKSIQEKNYHRIIFYAYRLNEVLYFKEKYKSPVIQVDMDHVIRTNCLAASGKLDKIDLLSDESYKSEMAAIREQSTAIVKNDYDFDTVIGNKIKYVIDFE